MKKYSFFMALMVALIATSCSQDEQMTMLPNAANNKIGYGITADGGTRASSAYMTGLDIDHITVSAWLRKDKEDSPNYEESNAGNTTYFLNDKLVHTSEGTNSGLFNYIENARFWPANGETLDFFAVVDNDAEAWDGKGEFVFNAYESQPGTTDYIEQLDIDEMPDMLYAFVPDQRLDEKTTAQQNVSFHFKHAFAKVEVSAEVRNHNICVYITDMEIYGVAKSGQMIFPHLEDKDGKATEVGMKWEISSDFTTIKCKLPEYVTKDGPIVLDMADEAKATIVGRKESTQQGHAYEDLLVIPNSYGGRNSTTYQTGIKLKGYAYNISDPDNGKNAKDVLIFGKYDETGAVVPQDMIIPIEFNWAAGTNNKYNIIFDCNNGGNQGEDPNHPGALIRIGYEVEVEGWKDVDDGDHKYDLGTK